MKRKTLTVVIACLFAGAAWAAGEKADKPAATGKPTASFEQMDANKDGVISSAEAAKDTSLNRMFKQLDADSDGKLTRSEYDGGVSGSDRPKN